MISRHLLYFARVKLKNGAILFAVAVAIKLKTYARKCHVHCKLLFLTTHTSHLLILTYRINVTVKCDSTYVFRFARVLPH